MDHALFKFGDKVDITQKYTRAYHGSIREWRRKDYVKTNCIYLGLRLLKNGTVKYDDEEGLYFVPNRNFRAALISPGKNLNPVYVPLSEIQYSKGKLR